MDEKVNELNQTQKMVSNILAGLVFIAGGVILLLSGLNILPVSVGDIILPVIFGMFSLILIFNAIIQVNVVALYLACIFIVCLGTSLLVTILSEYTYAQVYPLFFASIAVASLVALIYSNNKKFHLKIAIIIGVPSVLLLLSTLAVIGWEIALPSLIIFIGLLILYFVLATKKGNIEE